MFNSLKLYFNAIVREWVNRGFKNNYEYYEYYDDYNNTCSNVKSNGCSSVYSANPAYSADISRDTDTSIDNLHSRPAWATNSKIHYSMMAQLIQKDPSYYNAINLKGKIPEELYAYFLSMPQEYNRYGYIWPNKWTEEELNTLTIAELAGPRIIECAKHSAKMGTLVATKHMLRQCLFVGSTRIV